MTLMHVGSAMASGLLIPFDLGICITSVNFGGVMNRQMAAGRTHHPLCSCFIAYTAALAAHISSLI